MVLARTRLQISLLMLSSEGYLEKLISQIASHLMSRVWIIFHAKTKVL
jgi:hypothetical protein